MNFFKDDFLVYARKWYCIIIIFVIIISFLSSFDITLGSSFFVVFFSLDY